MKDGRWLEQAELELALELAEKILNRPNADPDDDLGMLSRQLLRQRENVERLRRGEFTEEEFQNLCHNLPENDQQRFFAGCSDYQRKLFGCDAVAEEREACARIAEEIMSVMSCSQDGHGIAAKIRARGKP